MTQRALYVWVLEHGTWHKENIVHSHPCPAGVIKHTDSDAGDSGSNPYSFFTYLTVSSNPSQLLWGELGVNCHLLIS